MRKARWNEEDKLIPEEEKRRKMGKKLEQFGEKRGIRRLGEGNYRYKCEDDKI